MISRYNGTCVHCSKSTKAGIDHYDLDAKESFHQKCKDDAENAGPSPEQVALAERLGYREIGWSEILRVLSASDDRGRSARDEPAALRRDDVWPMPAGDRGEE